LTGPDRYHTAAYNALPENPSTRQWLPFVNGDPAWPWLTKVTVSSAAPFTASLGLKYIDGDGTLQGEELASIPPWGSPVFTTPETFSGTLLLEADYPIYAVAHYLNHDQRLEGDGLMMATGIDDARGHNEIILDPVFRGSVNSLVAIQNHDDASSAVVLEFYDLAGSLVATIADSLAPSAALRLPLAAVPGLPAGYVGRLHVFGEGNISGLVFSYREAPDWAVAGESRTPSLGGGTVVNTEVEVFVQLPLLTNETLVVISNDGESPATFVLEAFDPSGNVQLTTVGQAPAKGMHIMDLTKEPLQSGFFGSAVLSADQHIAVKVQTHWLFTELDNMSDYAGISGSERLGDNRFPYVRDGAGDATTLIAAQNPAGESATIQIQYYDQDGTSVAGDSTSVPPYASVFFDQAAAGLPAGFRGSAVVTSTIGPVAAVALVSEEAPEGPPPEANLEDSYKMVQPDTFTAGDTLTFTVAIINRSPLSATVTFTDPIPAHSAYVIDSAIASDGGDVSFDGSMLSWQGSVSQGSPVTVQFAVATNSVLPVNATISNTATLVAGSGSQVLVGAEARHNPGNLLTINEGGLFTNTPLVDLRYAWDTANGVTQVQFSNDGGFPPGDNTSAWLPVDPADPTYEDWQITIHGDYVLPRTVYARFKDGGGQIFGPVQDDIIYDPVAPELLGLELVLPDDASAATLADLMVQAPFTATVIVTSTDDLSGVEFIELSSRSDFGDGQLFPVDGLRTEMQWRMDAEEWVYVRAIDRAGNASIAAQAHGSGRQFVFLPAIVTGK
jgi:uncharacterized repeat protein (TIGR01451 family)